MLGITEYIWRLMPGNPILLRVVSAAGKKKRDLFIRCGYLGILVAVVIWTIATSDTEYTSGDLSALAKTSANIFQVMAYVQLGLVALLSPIFTAGAITQEKDSQTYDILLSTPLTNGQILLGSLMSRVFFVIALLISGIPIFYVTQIFGGVAFFKIVESFLISAATAIITGAMAMAIATFKVGTRRTIFSFYLFIVIYLVGGFFLDRPDFFHVRCIDASGQPQLSQTSWLTSFHPFLATRVIFDTQQYKPPDFADLPANLRWWPISWLLTNPISFYYGFMMLLSLAMILPSVIFLRRVAQSSSSLKTWILQTLRLSSGDRTRKPRWVWNNPIAWREARTKASATRSTWLRWGFIVAGLGMAITLLVMYCTDGSPDKYIDHGFDIVRTTLYIQKSDGTRADDLHISPNATIKFETNVQDPNTNRLKLENRTMDDLNGKYEVKDFQQADAQHPNTITAITLREYPRMLSAHDARSWLLGITVVEFAVILLIVSNAAASTVTREKEDGTLDLLLTTPITSHFYIWGKLRGLVGFAEPLIAVPVASAALFIVRDMFYWALGHNDFQWIVFPEAVLLMPAMLVIVTAIAAILGMQMSLRCRTTVRAVMTSVGIMVGSCAALGWCGFTMLTQTHNDSQVMVALTSFSPFTLLTLLIDPYDFGGAVFVAAPVADIMAARIIAAVVAVIAISGYTFGVYTMYKSMVKNFDMTIRRQSR